MKVDETRICNEIWEAYKPRLQKLCMLKLSNYPDEVDDVISEVFLALCEQIEKRGIPDKPKAWIYGTFNNILNSKYREIYKAREKYVNLLDHEYKLPYLFDVHSKDILDRIYGDELQHFLRIELNENEYRLVQYIYYDKLKMSEIAALENSTEAAIKQRHYRLCNKLRWLAKKFER
ncbi:MAG: sigma-70 family RNA polymerase sigma factor [Ruminococcus sp.]|nr:sigma-70 family RNA polymerase sigma factor [Ruminococcus sp.]